MGVAELTVVVLQEQCLVTLRDSGFAGILRQTYRVLPVIEDDTAGFDADQGHLGVIEKGAEGAHGVGAAADAGDDLVRQAHDGPTIGLVLCRGRDKAVAEYALRGFTQPIGVSDYQLSGALPEALADKLPTVAELEAELEAAEGGPE